MTAWDGVVVFRTFFHGMIAVIALWSWLDWRRAVHSSSHRWGTTSSHLVLTSSNPFLYYCRLKSTGWSCWTLTLPTVQSSSFRRTCLTTHIHWPLLWPLSDWCVSNTVWLTCRNPWPISDGSLAWWFGPFKESESKLLHFWTLVSRPITNTQSDLHDQSWL